MEHKQAGGFGGGQRLAVHHDLITGANIQRGRENHRAIDADTAIGNPLFGVAPRAQTSAGHNLGDSLAGVGGGRSGHNFFQNAARRGSFARLGRAVSGGKGFARPMAACFAFINHICLIKQKRGRVKPFQNFLRDLRVDCGEQHYQRV